MLHFLTYKTQTNDIPLSQSPQAFIREIVVKNHIDVLSWLWWAALDVYQDIYTDGGGGG